MAIHPPFTATEIRYCNENGSVSHLESRQWHCAHEKETTLCTSTAMGTACHNDATVPMIPEKTWRSMASLRTSSVTSKSPPHAGRWRRTVDRPLAPGADDVRSWRERDVDRDSSTAAREGTRTPEKHERPSQRLGPSRWSCLSLTRTPNRAPELGKCHPATDTRRHQAATRSPVRSIVCSGYGHPSWSPWHAAANRGIQCPGRFPTVPRDLPRQRPSHRDRAAIPLIE